MEGAQQLRRGPEGEEGWCRSVTGEEPTIRATTFILILKRTPTEPVGILAPEPLDPGLEGQSGGGRGDCGAKKPWSPAGLSTFPGQPRAPRALVSLRAAQQPRCEEDRDRR